MNKYKIRFLQLFFLVCAVLGSIYYGPKYLALSFIIYVFLEIFVGNATLHRYYGHRSFDINMNVLPVFRWLAHHIGVGSVLGWTGHHRWHHIYSDTEKDLHSPTKNGLFHIIFGVWNANIPRKLIADLIQDKNLLWWHRNYFKYHLIVICLLIIFSPWALVFLYATPNLFCLLAAYIIAIVPHISGTAKNSVLTEILTFGEGGHLNHHNDATKYRFSQFDITGLCIKYFLKKQ
jgi:stearoyl-CoA desaturase (Delta-9 desaturase)